VESCVAKNPASPCQAELKAIGLPAGADFDTNHNGLHHWGWVEIISSREEERDTKCRGKANKITKFPQMSRWRLWN